MNFEFLLTYFDKGGFIFALLLMISLVSITIIIYKIFQFFFIDNANAEKLEILIQESASIREFENKILLLNNKENIFFSTIKYASAIFEKKSINDEDKVNAIKIHVQKKVNKVESFLSVLEIIAQVSPLLGLLGTILGMIASFTELEVGGSNIDPSILAGGIWTALLTTAIGLIVAIPALVAFHFFEKRVLSIKNKLNNLLLQLNGIKDN
mgnify:CR=1 FL=1|tara:strand:+ start:53095 stop:53724 length:630 start_codon:yes stop_codon:yes gene_type:complete